MLDQNNASQAMPVVVEEYKVPTEAEHKRLIRMLWIACVATGLGVFLVFGGIVLTLFLKGVDDKKIINVSTAVFQVLSMTAGVGFFIPLGLTSIVTLLLGIRMNRKSVAVLDKLDTAVESRLSRIDALFAKVEKFAGDAEKGELPAGMKRLLDEGKAFVSQELEALKSSIAGARSHAQGELEAALAEGERAAQAVRDGQESPAEDTPA